MNAVETLAGFYPWDVDPDEDLRRAVAFLGVSVTPSTLLRATYAASLASAGLTVLVAVAAPPRSRLLATLVMATLTALVLVGAPSVPTLLATARRVRALGDAPDLVARAVLRMRLAPSPERAADFAASAGCGPLAESLARHVRQARTGPTRALVSFGEEWNHGSRRWRVHSRSSRPQARCRQSTAIGRSTVHWTWSSTGREARCSRLPAVSVVQ